MVEAAIGVPIFLAAVCTILAMGQMIFLQMQVYYALSQTTQIYAQTASLKEQGNIGGTIEVYTLFHDFLEDGLCRNYIKGGIGGILLQTEQKEDVVSVQASYYLKVPVPYFNKLGFLVRKECSQRTYSGYIVHAGEGEETDPVVYVAEHGSVYHTTMECTHITIKISDKNTMRGIIGQGSHSPCKKCVKEGENYSSIYLTARGESYHSTLTCSALKRTIRAVRLSEVGGLRECQRCQKAGKK